MVSDFESMIDFTIGGGLCTPTNPTSCSKSFSLISFPLYPNPTRASQPPQTRLLQSLCTNSSRLARLLAMRLLCPLGRAKPLSLRKTEWIRTLPRTRAPRVAATVMTNQHTTTLTVPRQRSTALLQLTTPRQASPAAHKPFHRSGIFISTHLSPDDCTQLPTNTKLLHLFFGIQEIRSAVNKLTRPDGGFTLSKDLEARFLSFSYTQPLMFNFR